MNKKAIALCLAASMVITMMFTGCGEETTSDTFYDYDLSEYITLGEYKGIEYEAVDVSVTDEDIQEEIQSRLQAAATTEAAMSGIVAEGDTANIDYVGTMNGEAFQGGTDKGADLIIGSGSFIDGFESGLIGASVGETKVLELTFPDPYPNNPDFAGKPVEFTVTVNHIVKTIPPAYDLAFVTANSDAETIAEYEEGIKAELIKQAEEQAKNTQENTIWGTVVAGSKVLKYPDKEMQKVIEQQRAYYESYAAYMGSDLETLLSQTGSNQEEFETQLNSYAEQQVQQEMVVMSIARTEGLEITQEEYDAGVADLLKAQGFDSKEAYKEAYDQDFEEYAGKGYIELVLMFDKVMDFLYDNGKEVPAGTLSQPGETTSQGAAAVE